MAARPSGRGADLSIYASDQRAVLVTHDKEFSRRRRQRSIGWHIFLNCKEFDARDVFACHFDDVLPVLERHPHLYVELTKAKFTVVHASENWK